MENDLMIILMLLLLFVTIGPNALKHAALCLQKGPCSFQALFRAPLLPSKNYKCFNGYVECCELREDNIIFVGPHGLHSHPPDGASGSAAGLCRSSVDLCERRSTLITTRIPPFIVSEKDTLKWSNWYCFVAVELRAVGLILGSGSTFWLQL